MRITQYRLELVKDKSCNYGGAEYKIRNPWDIYSALNDVCKLNRQTEEVFLCICLNTKNKIIGIHEVSRGTLNSSFANSREVFKRAILNNSSKIIIAHNHPSGCPKPSDEDKDVTRKLKRAGEILDIELLDHLIVADDTYFSFKENNIL